LEEANEEGDGEESELNKAYALSSSRERTETFDSYSISIVRVREDMYASRVESVGGWGEGETWIDSSFFSFADDAAPRGEEAEREMMIWINAWISASLWCSAERVCEWENFSEESWRLRSSISWSVAVEVDEKGEGNDFLI
jgi:hypothetical protein